MELKLIEVGKKREGREIFKGVNLRLQKGEALALRGSNGSGKTTLIRMIAGIDSFFEGRIEKDFTENRIGYIPQDIVLFEDLSVLDNLFLFGGSGKTKKEMKKIISDYAERFGFREYLKKKVKYLSGGQKRLVNMMVSFVREPEILLLDESIVGVDEDKIQILEEFLLSIREEKMMIVTSHQDDFLQRVCNRFARIDGGELKIEN